MQTTSTPRLRNSSKRWMKPGRCFSEQVGGNAPGTANSSTLRPSNRGGGSTFSTPSRIRLSTTSGMRSPVVMVIAVFLGRREGAGRSLAAPARAVAAAPLKAPHPCPSSAHGRRAARIQETDMTIVRYNTLNNLPSRNLQEEFKQVFERFLGEATGDQ